MKTVRLILPGNLLLLVMFSCWVWEVNTVPTDHCCPPTQEWGCKKTCHRNCDELHIVRPQCTQQCAYGCECKHGLIFKSKDSKECVPYDQCQVNCTQNMHYNPCARAYDTTCKDLRESDESTGICVPKCVCDKGYIFNSGSQCIPISECPPE
uniref:TIL domain-containing protein n=1 Tax=Leptobrachium leishanense TaxID=445787 RepID=A0A8C5Q4G1_9ANUR